jgi:hypothetical protein
VDVDKVVELLSYHEPGIRACTGKDGIVPLGNQGAGKSTTISWLLGRPPARVQKRSDGCEYLETVLEVLNPLPGLETGQDQFCSEGVTSVVRCYTDDRSGLVYLDVPGEETKHITVRIFYPVFCHCPTTLTRWLR